MASQMTARTIRDEEGHVEGTAFPTPGRKHYRIAHNENMLVVSAELESTSGARLTEIACGFMNSAPPETTTPSSGLTPASALFYYASSLFVIGTLWFCIWGVVSWSELALAVFIAWLVIAGYLLDGSCSPGSSPLEYLPTHRCCT